MAKTTAHRPSQAHLEYVRNSKGERVRNTAYKKGTKAPKGNGAAVSSTNKIMGIAERARNQVPTQDHSYAINMRIGELFKSTYEYKHPEESVHGHYSITENLRKECQGTAQDISLMTGYERNENGWSEEYKNSPEFKTKTKELSEYLMGNLIVNGENKTAAAIDETIKYSRELHARAK